MFLPLIILTVVFNPATSDRSILCLGDSYTIGEGVEPKERWPMQMVELLKAKGIELDEPKIVAKTGWTTDELQAELDRPIALNRTYDWVTLLIGVNNQYRGRDVEVYRKEFRQLLDFAIEKAGDNPSRVIVLSIPDWGVTPFAADRDVEKIAREIDRYNQVQREESLAKKAHFVDITDITRKAKEDPDGLLVSDKLHPSGAMYQLWAQRVTKILVDQVTPKRSGE